MRSHLLLLCVQEDELPGFPCPGCGETLPHGYHSQMCGPCVRHGGAGPSRRLHEPNFDEGAYDCWQCDTRVYYCIHCDMPYCSSCDSLDCPA